MAFILPELNSGALYADGFEQAYLGYVENRWVHNAKPVAVYSRAKCIAILKEQGMSEEEAQDFFEFNVAGSYMGPDTPLFLFEDVW